MKPSRKPPLVVTLLGFPRLSVRGRLVPPGKHVKALELLAALCVRPGQEGDRSLLEGWLWPESPKEKAQACLRQALHRLRQILGPEQGRVRAHRRSLSVDLVGASVDVLAFDEAVRRGSEETLATAVELHRGLLLEGWDSEWIVEQRLPRCAAWVAAAQRLARMRADRGAHPEALALLERLLEVEPLNETAVGALMVLHASVGRHTDAIRVYRAHRAELNSELGTEPSSATSALHARLCREARTAAVKGVGKRRGTASAARDMNVAKQRVVLDGTASLGDLRFSTRIEMLVPTDLPATGWRLRARTEAP